MVSLRSFRFVPVSEVLAEEEDEEPAPAAEDDEDEEDDDEATALPAELADDDEFLRFTLPPAPFPAAPAPFALLSASDPAESDSPPSICAWFPLRRLLTGFKACSSRNVDATLDWSGSQKSKIVSQK